MYPLVYRVYRSRGKVLELERELGGRVDDCALCAGSLHLFQIRVHHAVAAHNNISQLTAKAEAEAQLRRELAAAIMELRRCFPDELHRASGAVDDVHTETDCWCKEAASILTAVKTRHSALVTGTKGSRFDPGGYNWQNIALLAGSGLVLAIGVARWFGSTTKDSASAGPGLHERVTTGLESAKQFFRLHLITPLNHIGTELFQGLDASKQPLQTAPLIDASAVALESLLQTWKEGHLKVVAANQGAEVVAELAKLAPDTLAAQSYQEQCLSACPAGPIISFWNLADGFLSVSDCSAGEVSTDGQFGGAADDPEGADAA